MLPATGYLRLWQIIGDRKKGIAPIIPIGRTQWFEGVKSGRYPASVKLGPRATAWTVESIKALMARIDAGVAA
jgi:prophage regulatory protein